MIARRSLCPEKLGSNPGQGSKGINFSGWHGLDMSITVTKRRYTPTNQTLLDQGMQTLGYMPVVCKHLWIIVKSTGGKNNDHITC